MRYDSLEDFLHWCNVYLRDEFLQIEPHGLRFGEFRLVFKNLEPEYSNLNKGCLTWRLSRTDNQLKIQQVEIDEFKENGQSVKRFVFYTRKRTHPEFANSTKFAFTVPEASEVKLMGGTEVLAAHKFCDHTLKYKLAWDTGLAEADCLTRRQAKKKLQKHFKQEIDFVIHELLEGKEFGSLSLRPLGFEMKPVKVFDEDPKPNLEDEDGSDG